ncbi:MAG: isochorismatase family protein [Polyangiaceae bacterium]|nr:isochorismatase family protein [Polyangiaceae bacterium]
MSPALLVVDMQNEFFAEGSPARASLVSAVEHINAAIQLFRRISAPVVVVHDIEEPDRVPGREGFALHPSLQAEAGDPRVHKRFGNAFWQTELDDLLRARSVDVVIVSGFCAENCVLDTFRGARERGYSPALLRGGLASPNADRIRFVEDVCEVVSYGALEGFLRVRAMA